MTRAIYNKAIYHRLQQMDRAVYRRANNVLPITASAYKVDDVVLGNGGTGYQVNDELTITGGADDTPAKITVTEVTPTRYTVSSITITDGGSGYVVGDTFDIDGDDQGDVSGTATVTAVTTVDNVDGIITELEITEGGSFDDSTVSITDNSSTGTGAVLSEVLSEIPGGGITEFTFTDGEYTSDLSGTFSLDSTTGSGATFIVTMAPVEEE